MFTYVESGNRQDELYVRIARKYRDIIFILVSDMDEYRIEKYFAYSLKARYWVSNGKYKRIVTDEEIERIRAGIDLSGIDGELINRITKLKKWYENQ